MTEQELPVLLAKCRTDETKLVERKPDDFKDKEGRKVIVAFANSTPEGHESMLFAG
jgi:hypothetical protein